MPESQKLSHPVQPSALRRIEHYALAILNGMAAGNSATLSDADIDMAIDTAERLVEKLKERGHLNEHE